MGQSIKSVLLYSRVNQDEIQNLGVLKKLRGQANAFRKLGIEADLVTYTQDGWLMNGTLHKKLASPLSNQLSLLWFIFFLFDRGVMEMASEKKYDLVYARYPLSTWSLYRLFRNLKQNNDRLKILVEFPTYPYRFEVKGILKSAQYLLDVCLRNLCLRKVDHIVHLGRETELFGRPTINSSNGIDVEEYRQSISIPIPYKIRMLAIGSWNYWHGIDRLLAGIKDYYSEETVKKWDVELKVVGEGGIVEDWEKMVRKYGIEDKVKFCSSKTGEELDAVFDAIDIAVGTLALHRKMLEIDSSLKHREYCARGIPFILSGKDIDFPKDLPFVKYFPAAETPIDINEIIQFYQHFTISSNIKNEIVNYSVKKLSWEKRLQIIRKELYEMDR